MTTEPWLPQTSVTDLNKFHSNTGNPSIDTDDIWYLEPDGLGGEGFFVRVFGGPKAYLRITFGEQEDDQSMKIVGTWHWRVPEGSIPLRMDGAQ